MGIGALRRHYADANTQAPSSEAAVDSAAVPAKGANKSVWAAFADSIGVDSTGTKAEIAARVETHLQAQAEAQVAADAAGVTTAADLDASAASDEPADDGEPTGEPADDAAANDEPGSN